MHVSSRLYAFDLRTASVDALGMTTKHRECLLLSEVADHCRVTVGTVRHWINLRRLQSFRLGRRRLVRRVDLDEFILHNLRSDDKSPLIDSNP